MKETTAIDHVCHMNVEIKSDSITYNHNDTIYYFCSNICKKKFSKNPENYLNSQESSSSCCGSGDHKPQIYSKNGKVQFYCPMLCEGEKLYDQAQDCPICNMALVPTSTIDPSEENKELKTNIKQLILNLVLGLPVITIAMIDMFTTNIITWEPRITQYLELVLSLPIGILSSYPLYKKAVRSIINQKYNMFTLLGTGIFISFFYSVIGTLFPQIFAPELQENNLVHIYFESVAAIVILFYFGQVLESNSIQKTNDALKSLMQMTTKDAIVIKNNQDIKIPIEEIKVGDKLRIKQGAKIPIDGKLIEGSVVVDESMINGEPLPTNKQIGDTLVGSTLNTAGNGIMQATSDAQHGILAQIIDAVNKAQRSKAEIQQLADKWAKFLVPIVAFISLASFIIWLFFDPSFAIIAAISVFIIACPCALGLATPIAIVVATSRAAKLGLLFKNAKSIEKIANIDTIVLDKTGTLTIGKPQIIDYYIENNQYHDIILQLTSQMEKVSNHPIASSLSEFIANKNLNYQQISLEKVEEIVGLGLKSSYKNNQIAIGSEQVLDENISPEINQKIEEFKQSNSTIIVFKSAIYGNALFALSDPIKETSKQAINNLKKMNITPVIASGDTKECTTYVANYLNIDTVYAKTLPNEKMEIVKKLQNEGKKVAMVGDGINDAPALSSADISIAMSQGSDIAIQTADITLVNGDINKIYSCITLSKKTMFIIKQNLFFSFFYNLAGVLLASGLFYSILGVLLHPIVAALAMSLSSVSVIFNSLRILKLKI